MGNSDPAIHSIFRSEGGGLTVQDIDYSIGKKAPLENALKKEFTSRASSSLRNSQNPFIKYRLDPTNYTLYSDGKEIDPNSSLSQHNFESLNVIEYRYKGPKEKETSKIKIAIEIKGIKCLPVKVTCLSTDSAKDLIEYLDIVCKKLIDKANITNKYSIEKWKLTLEGEEIVDVDITKSIEENGIEHEARLSYHHPGVIINSLPEEVDLVEVNFREMNGNTECIKCSLEKPFRLVANKYKKIIKKNDVNYELQFYYQGKQLDGKESLNQLGYAPEDEEDIMVRVVLE